MWSGHGTMTTPPTCTVAWEPKIPVAALAAVCLEKAARRRAALAPVLRAAAPDTSVAALTCRARRAFLQIYPEERQDERTVRRWLERARRRDRGRGEWERLELYLDERLTRRGSAEPTRALGAEMDRQKTALKTVTAQTQRIRVAVQEHAARVGLRLPPTDDPCRLGGAEQTGGAPGPPGTDLLL